MNFDDDFEFDNENIKLIYSLDDYNKLKRFAKISRINQTRISRMIEKNEYLNKTIPNSIKYFGYYRSDIVEHEIEYIGCEFCKQEGYCEEKCEGFLSEANICSVTVSSSLLIPDINCNEVDRVTIDVDITEGLTKDDFEKNIKVVFWKENGIKYIKQVKSNKEVLKIIENEIEFSIQCSR